jgi:hypothetical protein
LETNRPFSECSITNTETQQEQCTHQFTKERGLQEKKCNAVSWVGNAGENKCFFDILLKDSSKISQHNSLSG